MTGVGVRNGDGDYFGVDDEAFVGLRIHPAEEAIGEVFQVCIAEQGHACEAYDGHDRNATIKLTPSRKRSFG